MQFSFCQARYHMCRDLKVYRVCHTGFFYCILFLLGHRDAQILSLQGNQATYYACREVVYLSHSKVNTVHRHYQIDLHTRTFQELQTCLRPDFQFRKQSDLFVLPWGNGGRGEQERRSHSFFTFFNTSKCNVMLFHYLTRENTAVIFSFLLYYDRNIEHGIWRKVLFQLDK